MGIMVSEIYEALIAAGAPEDKAKAAAEAIPVSDLLATREDIAAPSRNRRLGSDSAHIARPENRWTKLEPRLMVLAQRICADQLVVGPRIPATLPPDGSPRQQPRSAPVFSTKQIHQGP